MSQAGSNLCNNRHNVLHVSRLHRLQDICIIRPITRDGQPSALPYKGAGSPGQVTLQVGSSDPVGRGWEEGGREEALLLDHEEVSLALEPPFPRGFQASRSFPRASWPACTPWPPYRSWDCLGQVIYPVCLSSSQLSYTHHKEPGRMPSWK